MPKETSDDADLDMLKRYAAQIGEHFDTVQIFATRQEGDGAVTFCSGVGNWYTRYGQVRLWCAWRRNSIGYKPEETANRTKTHD